jgi:RNA polymerase sigma-70 factor (ECF subfamily)
VGWKPRIIPGGRDDASPPASAAGAADAEPSDAELVHAVLSGAQVAAELRRPLPGHEAFRALVERYQGQVLRLACHLLRDADAARDVAQDAFLRAFRSLASFRPDGSFKNWVLQITVNAARDHQARQQGWRLRPLEEGDRAEGDIEGDVARAIDLDRIHRLLDRLAPREREVFVLRDLEGLDVEEVARVLGLEEPTIRRHLARARLRLRSLLDGSE